MSEFLKVSGLLGRRMKGSIRALPKEVCNMFRGCAPFMPSTNDVSFLTVAIDSTPTATSAVTQELVFSGDDVRMSLLKTVKQ